MQLAIISDSHHALDTLAKLLHHLDESNIHLLIHAGDFITSGVESVFKAHPNITTHIALGNCDYRSEEMQKLQALSHVTVEEVVHLNLENRSIAVSHIEGVAQNAMRGVHVDAFVHGHTHRPRIEKIGEILYLNPGSLMEDAGYLKVELPSFEIDRKLRF